MDRTSTVKYCIFCLFFGYVLYYLSTPSSSLSLDSNFKHNIHNIHNTHNINNNNKCSKLSRFIILFTRSSGSTWLMSVLNQQPSVLCYGEDLVFWDMLEDQSLFEKGLTPPFLPKYIRTAFDSSGLNNTPETKLSDWVTLVGCKNKAHQLADEKIKAAIFEGILKMNVTVVVLWRRNSVKQAISNIRKDLLSLEKLRQTGAYISNLGAFGSTIKDKVPPGVIPLAKFQNALRVVEQDNSEQRIWMSELVDYAASNGISTRKVPVMELYYEDILQDKEKALTQILSIDAHCRPTQSVKWEDKILKNTNNFLSEEVLNLKELKEAYLGTPYEPMFDG